MYLLCTPFVYVTDLKSHRRVLCFVFLIQQLCTYSILTYTPEYYEIFPYICLSLIKLEGHHCLRISVYTDIQYVQTSTTSFAILWPQARKVLPKTWLSYDLEQWTTQSAAQRGIIGPWQNCFSKGSDEYTHAICNLTELHSCGQKAGS